MRLDRVDAELVIASLTDSIRLEVGVAAGAGDRQTRCRGVELLTRRRQTQIGLPAGGRI